MATIPTAPSAVPFTNPYLALNPNSLYAPASNTATWAPPAPAPPAPDFYRNLAGEIPRSGLGPIAHRIITWQRDDESARARWLKGWSDAAEYLGLTYGERDIPWENASGVYDPLMLECMTRFQAEAVDSVFATGGPAKADVMGEPTEAKQASAQRVADHMNFVLSEEMEDFRQEKEQQFWGMGFCGVGFSKVIRNPVTGAPQSNYVRANMLFVPIGYSTLRKSPRIIEYMPVTIADVQRLKTSGFYSANFTPQTGRRQYDQAEKQDQRASGLEAGIGDDTDVELLEAHVELEIDPEPGYAGVGFPLPYVVTVDKRGSEIASIRRNWVEGDLEYKRRETYIEYVFIPTDRFGIYGIGLAHMMGNLSRAATGLLRGMLDAATLNNMRGGFRSNSLRIAGDDLRVAPGEWKAVDCDIEDMSKAFFAPPYLPPDQTLLELLGTLDTRGRRLAGNADIQVADIGSQTPVGTTLAVIERGMKVFNSIQARIAAALKRELRLIRDINEQNLKAKPLENGRPVPQAVKVKNRLFNISAQDYEDITVVPVVDPDSGTISQRVLQASVLTSMAQQIPGPFNTKALCRNSAQALGVKNTDDIIPPDQVVPPLDPVTENARLLVGQPVQAFRDQDHPSHIQIHQSLNTPEIAQLMATDPQLTTKQAALAAHVAEHLAFLQRERIEIAMFGQNAAGKPESVLPDKMSPEMEARLAPQLAQAAAQASQNPQPPTSATPQQPDPIAQQNAIDNQLQQEKLAQQKQIEAARLAQKQQQFEEKNATENKRIDLSHQVALLKTKSPPGAAPPGPAGPEF